MRFKNYINEEEYLKHIKFGIAYYPALIPPTDIEECKKLAIEIMADEKWADDDGNYTISTKEIFEKIEKELPKKEAEIVIKHETIHALQRKKAKYLLKGSTDLGDDITNDKNKYLTLPSEIMAFAYTNAAGDKKYEKKYKEIGGNVYKLYLHYIKQYGKQVRKVYK